MRGPSLKIEKRKVHSYQSSFDALERSLVLFLFAFPPFAALLNIRLRAASVLSLSLSLCLAPHLLFAVLLRRPPLT
jgi:hypothetical protein